MEDGQLRRLGLGWIGLAWIGMLFTALAIGLIGGIVRGDPAPVVMGWGISDFAVFAIAVYVVGVALAVGILWRLMKGRGIDRARIGLRGRLGGPAAVQALLAVVVGCALYALTEAVVTHLGIGMYWVAKTAPLVIHNALDLTLVVVFAVVLGPILEEVLFRGYLFTALRERGFGFFGAALLSGAVFASTHVYLGPGVMAFILVWSFLPAFLYWRHGSLHAAVLFHVLNNLIAYIVVPVVFS
jgi:membrane protease YdiL (CAAX protease family)